MADSSVHNSSEMRSGLASRTSGLMSSLRLVSLGTVVSRILGLLRDIAMTSVFGASTILDAFIVAFRIPNLARQLLGEGALSTAFLPIYIRQQQTKGDSAAREMMTAVAIASAAILLAILLLFEVAIGIVWWLLELSPSTRILLQLLAVMMPYCVLICLSALFCSALHARRQFLLPALVPIALNVVWLTVLGVTRLLVGELTTIALFSAGGVLIAGFVQLLIPLWGLHRQHLGLSPHWRNGWRQVKDVFSAMLPVVVGMSIIQMSAILDSLLAWSFSKPDDGGQAWCETLGLPVLMESGTASALYLGQRLYQFPLGVFGIALGTVLYPLLTQHAQAGATDLLRRDLSRGIRIMLAVALPASAGLCVMAWPLTRALFERGKFDLEDTVLTSRMIAIYACGVWCFIGIAILNRAFYATGDRKTPMTIGFQAFLLNLLLNLLLIWKVGGVGLAISSVLASLFQVCVTLMILNRRVGPLHWDSIFKTLFKGLFATVLMAGGCLLIQGWLPSGDAIEFKLIQLLVPCLVGLGIYATVAMALRMNELEELLIRP